MKIESVNLEAAVLMYVDWSSEGGVCPFEASSKRRFFALFFKTIPVNELMDKERKREMEKNLETFTPIEELHLMVRSYECLKRAGVDSVEKLKMLSEEDLANVRNLGRRNIVDIQRKLAEREEKNANEGNSVQNVDEKC